MNIHGDYLWKNGFVDIDGNPVERDKYQYPYSYDPYLVWIKDFEKGKNHVVYSDRLWQWDSDKYDRCCDEVWGNKGQYFDNRKPDEIERFLSLYFGEKIKLTAIMQGCNVSNGYPYWIFYYENESEET